MEIVFDLKKNSKVYVGCLPNLKTGGTELIHQLVYVLNRNGINAQILYCYGDEKTAEHPAFREYNCKYVMQIPAEDDNKNNVLIVPETYTRLLYQYKNIQKGIWWLSVDFYFLSLTQGNVILRTAKDIAKTILGRKNFKFGKDKNEYIHLCQSYYAIDFVKKQGCNKVVYLSDYINSDYMEKCSDNSIKKANVLYNPKKGIEVTRRIMSAYEKKYGADCNWIPLIDMTNEQVRNCLEESRVYIDFGNHPGKDRFPREAAICGCCVITGRRGAAQFYEDVPINDCYKIDDNNVDAIVTMIHACCKDYERHYGEFRAYREMILHEKEKFETDAISIFQIK